MPARNKKAEKKHRERRRRALYKAVDRMIDGPGSPVLHAIIPGPRGRLLEHADDRVAGTLGGSS
jgi:hypothetical protein